MNINFIREQILNPLQNIIGIVDKKQTMPILGNIHAEFNDLGILLTAHDLELQMQSQAFIPDFKNPDNLSEIIFSGNKLLDILKSLPEASSVKIQIKENQMLVNANNSRFKIQTLTGTVFPLMEQQSELGETLTIEQKLLKKIIKRTQYAMSIKHLRYYLTGALLKIEEEKIIMVTTDGHRLAIAQENILGNKIQQAEVIIPRKAIIELDKILKDDDSPIKLTLKSKQILFEFDSIKFISKLIDNKFPQYERVIPIQVENQIQLNRALALEVLNRVAVLSSDKVQGVRVLISQEKISILCANTDNEEANEEIPVEYQGEPIELGFNISYLIDVMSHLTEPIILMKFGDKARSVIFTFPENEEVFKYVVMPMRI